METAETETEDQLLTVRQAAKRLRVDDTTVRRWIKCGAMEAVALPHIGRRQAYRIASSTLSRIATPRITTQ